jgi:hypothetical protein
MLQLGFQHNAKGPRHCNDRASCRRCARDAVSGCYHAKKSTPLQDIAGHDVTRGQTTPLCRAMPTLIRDVSADAAAPDARDRWSFTLLAHASSVPIVATTFWKQPRCMYDRSTWRWESFGANEAALVVSFCAVARAGLAGLCPSRGTFGKAECDREAGPAGGRGPDMLGIRHRCFNRERQVPEIWEEEAPPGDLSRAA